MKRSILFFLSSLCLLAATLPAAASDPDYEEIADRIVNQSLAIQPGEFVIIRGLASDMSLMGELIVAIEKAGGDAEVYLSMPEAEKRAIMATSKEMLAILPHHTINRQKVFDVVINLNSSADPRLYSDVPEDKLAVLRKTYAPVYTALSGLRYRSFYLASIPSDDFALYYNADPGKLREQFWHGVIFDTDTLRDRVSRMSKILKKNTVLHITSSYGTDVSFKIDSDNLWVNTGQIKDAQNSTGPIMVGLPAGDMAVCVKPKSASGKVVIPIMEFRGRHIQNVEITFSNGRIQAIKSDNDVDIMKKYLDSTSGDIGMLSGVAIGLNSNMHPIEGSSYLSSEMEGVVTMVTGDLRSFGCKKVTADGTFGFALSRANVIVDGEAIVGDGKLLLVKN